MGVIPAELANFKIRTLKDAEFFLNHMEDPVVIEFDDIDSGTGFFGFGNFRKRYLLVKDRNGNTYMGHSDVNSQCLFLEVIASGNVAERLFNARKSFNRWLWLERHKERRRLA